MNVVVAILGVLLWVLLVPMCVGLAFNFILPRARRTVGITFILGFLVYMAVFEVIAIFCMTRIVYSAFSYCRSYFTVAALILAVFGIARSVWVLIKCRTGRDYLVLFPGEAHADIHDLMSPRTDLKMFKLDYPKESIVYWCIFFAIMTFQMVMAVVMASFDGDDAYYVVESLLAQQADVMNTILPYTGTSTYLDIRHALAVITMWIAFVAKQSGIHATILSHSIIPLFVIPLVYLIYVEIGRILFRERQQIIPVFLIVVAVLLMFGNVSIYTPATFFLMRTWQGKALVANLVFPMIFWLFLWMMEDVKRESGSVHTDEREVKEISNMLGDAGATGAAVAGDKGTETPVVERYRKLAKNRLLLAPWAMLTLVNMLSGVCSSLGVIFGSGLVALLTLVLLFYSKRITVLLGAFACIIPNMAYLAIYFFLFRG
ncbi:DUF6077 domain-containing protein [Butyrivibrio sp. AE2032]|uniref:DUF6077 domain-containing protein n=1 Tax=Butyrivibrio sp. AE2032 TaxID=1458463 RepID=UPI000555B981|nr:DUF6077 domain-containing protein [Butyrivibrio sp. AE2032]